MKTAHIRDPQLDPVIRQQVAQANQMEQRRRMQAAQQQQINEAQGWQIRCLLASCASTIAPGLAGREELADPAALAKASLDVALNVLVGSMPIDDLIRCGILARQTAEPEDQQQEEASSSPLRAVD